MIDKYGAYKLLELAVEIDFPEYSIVAADDSTVILENRITKNRYSANWSAQAATVEFENFRPYEWKANDKLKEYSKKLVIAIAEEQEDLARLLMESYIQAQKLNSEYIDVETPTLVYELADNPATKLSLTGKYVFNITTEDKDNQVEEIAPLIDKRHEALTLAESKIARELVATYYEVGNKRAAKEFLRYFGDSIRYITESELESVIKDIARAERLGSDAVLEFLEELEKLGCETLDDEGEKLFSIVEAKFGSLELDKELVDELLSFVDQIVEILQQRNFQDRVSDQIINKLRQLKAEYEGAASTLAKNAIITKIAQEVARIAPPLA